MVYSSIPISVMTLLILKSSALEGHNNVTEINISGSVSVSIKAEGVGVTALLLLLSSPDNKEQQIHVTTKCNSSKEHQDDATSKIEERDALVPAKISVLDKGKLAKVTLKDIVALRVTGEKSSMAKSEDSFMATWSTLRPPVSDARNCLDLQEQGEEVNGVYIISPYDCCPNRSISVYCDLKTDGGGWTVIQRRDLFPHQEDFYRGWDSYVVGFGDLFQEFWLGLDNTHALTNQSDYEIRFDLEDFQGERRWAKYSQFSVGSAASEYRMEASGYSGTARDSFMRHNGMTFVTKDHESMNKCASTYKGAWWYSICHDSNLNGQYLRGPHTSYGDGINWRSWKGYYYSLKFTEMKIRPKKKKKSQL